MRSTWGQFRRVNLHRPALQTSAEARRRAPAPLARGAAKAVKPAGTSRRRSDGRAVAHAVASCRALSSDAGCVWSAGGRGGGGDGRSVQLVGDCGYVADVNGYVVEVKLAGS